MLASLSGNHRFGPVAGGLSDSDGVSVYTVVAPPSATMQRRLVRRRRRATIKSKRPCAERQMNSIVTTEKNNFADFTLKLLERLSSSEDTCMIIAIAASMKFAESRNYTQDAMQA